ncbi:hypothetical protein MKZ38_003004 [Zalerion maritima]|uniref:DNA polymerase epsilon subunit B n=1 Tax=Zalerion maritima TaxID=339359 RepID=A0AAD5RNA9_9PEZI|nr:hypothetical protein MKZ38_003004 [Zalerion maritima]
MAFHTPKPHPVVSKLHGKSAIPSSSLPSSSPAFGTPVHPLKPFDPEAISKTTILPIILPPATLRPLAFRVFTKKHSLTITSAALQELATFVGKHCGAGWKEEGLAEKILEEAAKSWKTRNGGVIVNGDKTLKEILKTLEGSMRQGKVMTAAELSRQNSLDKQLSVRLGLRPVAMDRTDSNSSVGLSRMAIDDDEEDDGGELLDPRKWLKVIDAYQQPRYTYNVSKKQFEKEASKPSLLPSASHKTAMFRNRYHVIHQRLLRNESFQQSAVTTARGPPSLSRSASDMNTASQTYKITPIANLLGRHGSHHMLLGLLAISPTGTLAVSDLTGTIDLDLSQAVSIPDDSAWYVPGMIVLVDGVYEEEEENQGKGLGGSTGVGGTLGGRFQGFFIGHPPCERRKATLGVTGPDGTGSSHTIGGGFGWIDFLGVGSERALGTKMRRLEQRILRRAATSIQKAQEEEEATGADDSQLRTQDQTQTQAEIPQKEEPQAVTELPGRNRIVIIGELNLDNPRALQALRKVLAMYATEPEGRVPISFVLVGNFMSRPTMARTGGAGTGESAGGGGSVEYKECFDELSAILADFPSLIQGSTFVLVPGDNDGWASSFGGGASVPLPRKPVPQIFTSRIRRTVTTANAEADKECEGAERTKGEIAFTSNPARISIFGPVHEILLFRDDVAARLRRTAVRIKSSVEKPEDGDGQDIDVSEAAPETQGSENMDLDLRVQSQKREGSTGKLSYDVKEARKLVKTLLDQGYLAPFRPQIRPVNWDWANTMHLYPLPTAMVLVDTTIPPFTVTYEGCHVVNPGSLVVAGRRNVARWAEYTVGSTGKIRECMF